MEIRLAAIEDLPRIVELSNQAAERSTANFATEPEPVDDWIATWRKTAAFHPWLVADADGAVVGFARSGPHKVRGAYAWIAELSVYLDASHHGRGVGTALYGVLIPLLRAQGYVTLLAGITAGHVASERLHARFGFRHCGTFHRAGWKFDGWHDVGYWELDLRPGDAPPAAVRPVAAVWSTRAIMQA